MREIPGSGQFAYFERPLPAAEPEDRVWAMKLTPAAPDPVGDLAAACLGGYGGRPRSSRWLAELTGPGGHVFSCLTDGEGEGPPDAVDVMAAFAAWATATACRSVGLWADVFVPVVPAPPEEPPK
jgi:hypothetical protein